MTRTYSVVSAFIDRRTGERVPKGATWSTEDEAQVQRLTRAKCIVLAPAGAAAPPAAPAAPAAAPAKPARAPKAAAAPKSPRKPKGGGASSAAPAPAGGASAPVE